MRLNLFLHIDLYILIFDRKNQKKMTKQPNKEQEAFVQVLEFQIKPSPTSDNHFCILLFIDYRTQSALRFSVIIIVMTLRL